VSTVAHARNSHRTKKWAQRPVFSTLHNILELMICQAHVDFFHCALY
jgi:hypothetical protein